MRVQDVFSGEDRNTLSHAVSDETAQKILKNMKASLTVVAIFFLPSWARIKQVYSALLGADSGSPRLLGAFIEDRFSVQYTVPLVLLRSNIFVSSVRKRSFSRNMMFSTRRRLHARFTRKVCDSHKNAQARVTQSVVKHNSPGIL